MNEQIKGLPELLRNLMGMAYLLHTDLPEVMNTLASATEEELRAVTNGDDAVKLFMDVRTRVTNEAMAMAAAQGSPSPEMDMAPLLQVIAVGKEKGPEASTAYIEMALDELMATGPIREVGADETEDNVIPFPGRMSPSLLH